MTEKLGLTPEEQTSDQDSGGEAGQTYADHLSERWFAETEGTIELPFSMPTTRVTPWGMPLTDHEEQSESPDPEDPQSDQ